MKLVPWIAIVGLFGCAAEQEPAADTTELRAQVLENYGVLVYLDYQEALRTAMELQAAVDILVADPTPTALEVAREAWLASRIPYGQTEAFRFSGGPIDAEDGPEGRLNAWPLDERFIDYVEGADASGIVNNPQIELTKERLASLTEGGEGDVFGQGATFDPEKAIATGYHAIEFLLWGQDLSNAGPGARPFADYVTGASAAHPNGDRRGRYLQVVAQLLVDDLQTMVDAWAPDTDNFRRTFIEGDPDEGLRTVITGLGILSKGELGGERMDVALDSLDQEDEHSCFSDNTHVDIEMNALGIENVYLGRYGDHDGPGIDEVVAATDPGLDAEMKALLTASLDAIHRIPAPFDQAIATSGSDGWHRVDTAVTALFDQGDAFVPVAEALGLGTISVELPE